MYLAANHLECGGAANQHLPSEGLAAAWANAWLVGVVFYDPFNETFHQRTFAALAVFEQSGLALKT